MTLRKTIALSVIGIVLTTAVLGWALLAFATKSLNLTEAARWVRSRPELFRDVKDTILENDKDVRAIGKTRNLPIFRLVLSRKDIVHFADLHEKLEDPDFGVAYYAEHNLWRGAVLEHQGKTYDVQVKSHGRSPSNHRNGKYISLSVKLQRGEQIANSRRFSLLVRDHFRPDKQIVFDLAREFGLLMNQEQLVRVAINNWDEKLYFFDRRLDVSFMEVDGRPSMRLFGYADSPYTTVKSSIHTAGDFDATAYRERFMQTLKELEYPESQHEPLCQRFVDVNTAIAEKRYSNLERFFDIDYLSSFEAVRMIAALNGHSIGRSDNLYVFYDTANGLFYPAITRDCTMTPMQFLPGGSPELYVNTVGIWELPMFRMISQNDRARQATYRKIYDFIRSDGATVGQRHQLIRERFDKLSYYGWAMVALRRLGKLQDDYTTNNLKVLKQYLDKSEPELGVTAADNQLVIELLPRSLSAINIDRLVVETGVRELTGDFAVTSRIVTEDKTGVSRGKETRHVVAVQAGRIDLTPVVANLRFSTALDAQMQRSPRKYTVLLKLDRDAVHLSSRNVSLSLANTISGQRVVPSRAVARDALATEIRVPPPSQPNSSPGWRTAYLPMNVSRTEGRIVVHRGDYALKRDILLPKGLKLVIEAGTKLRLGSNRALVSFDGIDILGTESDPVTITSIKPNEPFGSVGVLGDRTATSTIRHLRLSNGNERWVNGVYFSGALSLHYNGQVEVVDSVIERNHADDGLNVKYGEINIQRCLFRDNAADQVDLDLCDGTVADSRFLIEQLRDANGDGLDVSGSTIVVQGCRFEGFADKGMSVGEASNMVCRDNRYLANTVGIAVKDSSNVCLTENLFSANTVDVDVFQKKTIFAGGSVFFDRLPGDLKLFLDVKSTARLPADPESFAHLAESIVNQESQDPSDGNWMAVEATILSEPTWRAESLLTPPQPHVP